MAFTLLELIRAFGISLIVGFSLAVLYELFRIFHKIGFSKSLHYFICDFVFMIISAFITYFACLVLLEGSVRLFVIAGECLGFVLFCITIKPIMDRIYNPVIKFSEIFTLKLLKITRKIMYNIYVKSDFMFKRIKNKVMKYVWKKKERKSYSSKRIRKLIGNTTKKEKA